LKAGLQGAVVLQAWIGADGSIRDLKLMDGSLLLGQAAVKAVRPSVRVIGVEPEFAADARDSLRRGARVAWAAADTARTKADSLRVEQVGELLAEIARRGVAILLVEQKLAIALKICARLYVMGHGRIVFHGTPAELAANPAVRREWLEV